MSDAISRTEQNKKLVRDCFQAWANGTGGPFDLLADDALWTIEGTSVAAKTYQGRKTFIREVVKPMNARLGSRLKPKVRSICADGDIVVVFFDGEATARDGKPYNNTYFWQFEMRDGKVVKASAMYDSITFNDLWSRVTPEG
jgi:ketosteroid isomerase-like protein